MYYDQTTKLLVKLNKITAENEITWEAIDAPRGLTDANEDVIHIMYWTDYKEKKLAIYLRKYKHFYDEFDYHWSEGIVFSIVNENFKTLWDYYEQTQALRDLYESVAKQASGFDDLFD